MSAAASPRSRRAPRASSTSPAPSSAALAAQAANTDRYGALFRHLLERGIYFPPSQFEALFISTAHGNEEIERTVQAVADFDG